MYKNRGINITLRTQNSAAFVQGNNGLEQRIMIPFTDRNNNARDCRENYALEFISIEKFTRPTQKKKNWLNKIYPSALPKSYLFSLESNGHGKPAINNHSTALEFPNNVTGP